MKKLERFIPQTPDPYLKQADQLGAVKFGHINALVDAINSTIYGDYLQLEGDGPMSTTLRALEDPEGNKAKLFLATDQTKIEGLLTITDILSIEGRLELKADPTATKQTTAVIQATDTDSGIAIVPNGTGAFTLDVPDGAITGGNARGSYSVDFQRTRINANDGARGNRGFIGNGNSNEIGTISYGAIVNGIGNIITGELGFIGNGESNFTSSVQSVITGGKSNTCSSNYGVISGGQSNTASTNTHATVVGGYQNSSTGQYSISGGYSNVASGLGSVALGYDNNYYGSNGMVLGNSNTISGQNNLVSGNQNTSILGQQSLIIGRQNETTIGHAYGLVVGYYGKAYLHSQWVQSNEGFGTGSQQASSLIARKSDTLTTGATTVLFLDYLGKKIIPDGNNRVWNVTVKYTAVVTLITGTATGVSVGDCKNEVLTIGFKKIGGTSSVVGSLNTLSTNEDISMSTASFGVTAGASQEMKLDFTAPTFLGGGSVTTRVVAKVELTEVAY